VTKTVEDNGEINAALMPWQSKIVGHDSIDPAVLLDNPHNWRMHTKEQMQAMGHILDEIGWVQDVIVNKNTQHIVDGHLRVFLAKKRREPTVPIILVDLTEGEEKIALAMLDTISAMAKTDKAKARALAKEVRARNEAMQTTFMDLFGDKFMEEEIPEQPTDAAFAEHNLAGKEDYGEQQKNVPTSMRVIQVFVYPHVKEHLSDALKRMAKLWGTSNITDTVIAAIEYAAKGLLEGYEPVGANLPTESEEPTIKHKEAIKAGKIEVLKDTGEPKAPLFPPSVMIRPEPAKKATEDPNIPF
jgi:hypothetical protein